MQQFFKALRTNELHGSGRVFPNMGDQSKRTARRDVVLLRPSFNYFLVVWQQAPEEGVNFGVAVLG